MRSVKEECHNRVIGIGVGVLRRATKGYVTHYLGEWNHLGLDNQVPESVHLATAAPAWRDRASLGIKRALGIGGEKLGIGKELLQPLFVTKNHITREFGLNFCGGVGQQKKEQTESTKVGEPFEHPADDRQKYGWSREEKNRMMLTKKMDQNLNRLQLSRQEPASMWTPIREIDNVRSGFRSRTERECLQYSRKALFNTAS